MKFKVTTMLPIHTTAVKRDYLNCCLACGYWYTAVGFQLNDVITSTALNEYDVIRQITDLREYTEYDYKTGSEAFTRGLSIWRIQKHGSKGYQNSRCKLYELKLRFILMGNYSTF